MKKLSIIFVIIWMIIIFLFSNTPSSISSNESHLVLSIFIKVFHYTGNVDLLHTIIRKIAHFVEYLILGIFVLNACKYNGVKDILKLSILICMLYACSDEIHQLFVSGRSGKVLDVCIDTFGSLMGIFIYNKLRK
ncbi:MAG: VanZ family protein [Bacilli bacterium]|nr:VanZ family protein [Bacilli bacterium]